MSEPVSKLQQALESGKFVVTGEIGPPKGVNVGHCLEETVKYLKGKVVAVNVTDLQTAVMRIGSMAISHMLVDHGIEPIFQMVTRDRNRLALESDLLSAYALGIRNMLSLTGDHVTMGDHPQARPVYDLDSVSLLQTVKLLESGTDLGRDVKGNPNVLDGVPKFFKGASVTPCADAVEPQIIKMEKKVAAGAQFIQTQAVYDPAAFEKFMKRVEHLKVPVLVGIVVLKTAAMAKYMNKSVPGVKVPDHMIKLLTDAPKEKRQEVATQIAADLVRDMKGMCSGAHLMTLGWDHIVPDIIERAGVKQ